MTGSKNSRVSKDTNTFQDPPSPTSSSSSSSKSSSKTKGRKNIGSYQTLAIKIAQDWEPMIKSVVSSYCHDEQLKTLGQSGRAYCALKLHCATEVKENRQVLLMNRRFKSKLYAPNANKCWFFLVIGSSSSEQSRIGSSSSTTTPSPGNEPETKEVYIIPCSADKTTKNYFVQDELIPHTTSSPCKIGWIISYSGGVYIHVITGLASIEGIVENVGKIKECPSYSCVSEHKPRELLSGKKENAPKLEEIYPNFQNIDASVLTGLNLRDHYVDRMIENIAQHFWKGAATQPILKKLKEEVLNAVQRIKEEQDLRYILEEGYSTDE